MAKLSTSEQLISTEEMEQEILSIMTVSSDVDITEESKLIMVPSPLIRNEYSNQDEINVTTTRRNDLSPSSSASSFEQGRQHLAEGAFLLTCALLGLILLVVFYKQVFNGLSTLWNQASYYMNPWSKIRMNASWNSSDEKKHHIVLNSPCWQALSQGNGQDDYLVDITRLRPLIHSEDVIRQSSSMPQ